MDWDLVIKRKSEALNAVVAGLFAMLELSGEAVDQHFRVVNGPRSAFDVLRVDVDHSAVESAGGPAHSRTLPR